MCIKDALLFNVVMLFASNTPVFSVRVPAIITLWLFVSPLLLFTVKLLMFPVNVPSGILCDDEPLNTTVAAALLASIFPEVLIMFPFKVKVLEPTVKVPEESDSVVPLPMVSAPVKLLFAENTAPLALVTVKEPELPKLLVPVIKNWPVPEATVQELTPPNPVMPFLKILLPFPPHVIVMPLANSNLPLNTVALPPPTDVRFCSNLKIGISDVTFGKKVTPDALKFEVELYSNIAPSL